MSHPEQIFIPERFRGPPESGNGGYRVTGWRIGVEGKKHFAGTAIFDKDDSLIAAARAVWIGRMA